jgi:hypothetical protein
VSKKGRPTRVKGEHSDKVVRAYFCDTEVRGLRAAAEDESRRTGRRVSAAKIMRDAVREFLSDGGYCEA